jgi:hypothetical protein
MTDKSIKSEQWSIKELLKKIKNGKIKHPKYQRKKKWTTRPKKNNTPNERSYIEFLQNTENSVHAITLGSVSDSQGTYYTNIDGNNRINAIKHFDDKPFEIFPDYLEEIKNFINENISDTGYKIILNKIFEKLSYNDIIYFKWNHYFKDNDYKDMYNDVLQILRDSVEDIIERLQYKLKINENDLFDLTVKMNINVFEGYTSDELCKIFEEINKFNSKLTETELLGSQLYNITDFTINNNIIKTEIGNHIEKYYVNRSDDEALDSYIHDVETNVIDAYDFIIGFQNRCASKYNFIENTNNPQGLSLFFRLYKLIYKKLDKETFITPNVNNFIEKINKCCYILERLSKKIFTEQINESLFNSSCKDKFKTIKKNTAFILLSGMFGFLKSKLEDKVIMNKLEKVLLFHFMLDDIKDTDKKADLRLSDSLSYQSDGGRQQSKTMLNNPELISNKVTEESFNKLIDILHGEQNIPDERFLPNNKKKNDKRRNLKFNQKTLMFYYYKNNVPTNMLENEFSIEHICPNSSEWKGKIDKDRTGNLIPIISSMNSSRGNKHINSYRNCEEWEEFYNIIKDIIPDDQQYNEIVDHNKIPFIKDNVSYNDLCKSNEEKYKINFIKCLFNE